MTTKKPKFKAADTKLCFDEVDGIMSLPPENEDVLKEQVEYMRCKLNRPKVKDKDITIALLQWQWAWLHMRYQTPDNSENGLRILRWHTSREVSYRKEYEKDEVARSGEEE